MIAKPIIGVITNPPIANAMPCSKSSIVVSLYAPKAIAENGGGISQRIQIDDWQEETGHDRCGDVCAGNKGQGHHDHGTDRLKGGAFRETVARNRPIALKVIAESSIIINISRNCKIET